MAGKLPSRQPSVASVTIPGTPMSEQVSISDNVSMASTSQSRTNSPPPTAGNGRVGSAPVRNKTKNQMKKERQERAKAMEEQKSKVEEVTKAIEEGPAQEAIVSRKKKTKKEKEPRAKPKTSSDTPSTVQSEVTSAKETPTDPEVPNATLQAANEKENIKGSQRVEETETNHVKQAKAATAVPKMSAQPPQEPSPPPTPTLNAAQILADLKSTVSPDIQKCIDSFFRSPAAYIRAGQSAALRDYGMSNGTTADLKPGGLTKEKVEGLLRGTLPCFRYGGESGSTWDRGMITPSGAHLRALTEELENRVLELEKNLREFSEELKFHPTKPQNEMKFPAFDLENLTHIALQSLQST